jgi:putative cardiolipin synthase
MSVRVPPSKSVKSSNRPKPPAPVKAKKPTSAAAKSPRASSAKQAPFDASAVSAAKVKAGLEPPGLRLGKTWLPISTPSLAETFDKLKTAGGGPAKARLLPKNMDAWNARWEMVKGATKTIDASYFSFEKDVFGFALLGGMLKKQMEGVHVRVMTDAMADDHGQRGFTKPLRGKDYLQELVNHGGEAYVYNPLWKRPFELFEGGYAVLASNHDKILATDGKKGITGGRNIGIDYLTEPADRKGAWRDMDVELDGEGPAKGLSAAFDAELVGGAASKVHKDLLGNWVKRDLELVGAYEMMDLWLNAPPYTEGQKAALRKDPEARKKIAHGMVLAALEKLKTEPIEALRRKPNEREIETLEELAPQLIEQLEARGSHSTYLKNRLPEHDTVAKIIDQTSTAGTRINGMAPAFQDLLASATERIVIENPYVVLSEDMMKALESADKKGVEINIITNSPLSTDSDITQAFFLDDWKMVLARCPNAHIYVATGNRKFHTKSAVIDDEESLITTYNLDLLSGYVNGEVGAVVKSKELARELLKEFENDKKNPANGFLEYTIKKDAQGRPIIKDGKPQRLFGPEDHLPADVLEKYKKKSQTWGHTIRNAISYFEPLRHPPLEDTP